MRLIRDIGEIVMEINDNFILQLILDISNVKFTRKFFKAYNVQDVDQFLDDLISNLRNNIDNIYKLKQLEYMINEKEFKISTAGYNMKEVDEFLDSLIRRITI